MDSIVINTGPLIALEKVGTLDFIGNLPIQFVTPQEVMEELEQGVSDGYTAINPKWLKFCTLSRPLPTFSLVMLDKGKAAVIQLAQELSIQTVCIDERKARKVAKAIGLTVTGSLGLLIQAKKLGHIEAVRPYIERYTEAGIWQSRQLLELVLQAVDEAD